MSDIQAASTFEKYARGMSVLTPEQMERLKGAQQALRGFGIQKGLEELSLLMGFLDPARLGALAQEIKKQWGISIPRPVPSVTPEEKDKALQESLVQQGPQPAAQVLEARKIQEELLKLGLPLRVSDILAARGNPAAKPAPAAPAPAPAPKPEPELELGPAPAPSKVAPSLPVRPQARPGAPPSRPAGPGRKPAAGMARPAGAGPARDRDAAPAAPPSKKNSKLVLGLAVGGLAAVILVLAVVVLSKGGNERTAEKVTEESGPKFDGKTQLVLFDSNAEKVRFYSDANLLDLLSGTIVAAEKSVSNNSKVTALARVRMDEKTFCQVRTGPGNVGWVRRADLRANYSFEDADLKDLGPDWTAKVMARKGIVAKEADPASAPLEASKVKFKPREPEAPAPEPAKTPEPAKPAEPEPAATPQPEKKLLAGYWKFDEGSGTTTADISGNGNTGTLLKGPKWVGGVSGKALAFDGDGASVRCGVAGMPESNAPQSIAGWWSAASVPANVQKFVSLTNPSIGNGVSVGYRDRKVSVWKSGGVVLVSAPSPSTGAWHHFAYTYDGINHRLYIDGTLAQSAAVPPTLGAPSNLQIGGWEMNGQKEYFAGVLDEIQIFTVALGEEQIRELVPSASLSKKPDAGAGPKPAKPAPPAAGKVPRGGNSTSTHFVHEGPNIIRIDRKGIVEGADILEVAEGLYSVWEKKLGRVAEQKDPYTLRTYFTRKEYNEAGGKGTSYLIANGTMHMMNDGGMNHNLATGGTQLYLSSAYPNLSTRKDLPPWILAGICDYFGSARIKGGKVEMDAILLPETNQSVLSLQFLAKGNDWWPFEKGWKSEGRDYEIHRRAIELQAWALFYYLFNGPTETGGGSGKNAEAVPEFLAALDAGKKVDEALDGILKRLGANNLGGLERLVKDYFVKMKAEIPDREEGDFLVAETAHYTISVQKGSMNKKTRVPDKGILQEFKYKMELLFEKYSLAFHFQGRLSQKAIMKMYRDRPSYLSNGGPGGSAAYYSPATKELVGYEDSGEPMGGGIVFNIFCHEGCHQFFDLAFPGFYEAEDIPMWFSEGLADCFGASEIRGKDIYVFTLGGVAAWRVESVKEYLQTKQTASLKSLLELNQPGFMSGAHIYYPQAWSFVHFLWNYPSLDQGKGQYSEVLIRLIDGFKTGRSRDEVYKEAFQVKGKPINLDQLEDEWKAYVKTLRVRK
jgi:hypothetical protein